MKRVLLTLILIAIALPVFAISEQKENDEVIIDQALLSNSSNSNAAEVDFGPWMIEFERRVKNNWKPPKQDKTNRVIVKFKVNRAGELFDYHVLESSKVKSLEQSAIKALKQSAPLLPLPKEYTDDDIEIEYTFDYNVFSTTKSYSYNKDNSIISLSMENNGIDFAPYMKKLKRKIKGNWNPPKGDKTSKVVLTFKLSREGELLDYEVFKSSKVELAEQAAINALTKSAPFPPLPKEYTDEDIEIEFNFDYKVIYAGSDSKFDRNKETYVANTNNNRLSTPLLLIVFNKLRSLFSSEN